MILSRIRSSVSPAAALTLLGLVVGSAAAGFALADPSDERELAPPPPDTRPGPGPRSVEAVTAQSLAGEPMGVLVYRNERGARCFAIGKPNAERIVAARGGREVPLGLAGSCPTVEPAPIIQRIDQTPEGVMVYGLAAEDVVNVEMSVGGRSVVAEKAADGGFIGTILAPKLNGQPILRVQKADGESELVEAPALVDIDAQNKRMREEARKLGLLDDTSSP